MTDPPAPVFGMPRGHPSLHGREQPLTLLREWLAAAMAGHGRLVLLGGTAGVGKTTLIEALAGEAAGQGALALTGRCYDLTETPPYGPWADLFDRYAPGAADPPPPDVLPRHGRPAVVADRAALFHQVEATLADLAARRPLLVLLDDLHWADPDSLDLLRQLARRLASRPILMIAAYRDDEVLPQHPLYQLLPILVRESGAIRLGLRPLDDDAVAALVAGRHPLPSGEVARLARYLQRRAEGNPLFIGELLQALLEEGLLRPDGGGWRLGDLAHARLPAFLRQVIERRVSRLGGAARALLTVAAVIGQDVPLDAWLRVADAEEEALLAAVDHAVDAGIVAADAAGTHVQFTHALIREALYERLLPPRRRALHRRVAETLLDQADPDPDAVASHLQRAGDARSIPWLIRAGDRAYLAYAWHTASARYEAALALLADDPGGATERCWILLRLAEMRRYGDPHTALGNLDEVAALAGDLDAPDLAALAGSMRGLMRVMAGDVRAGLDEAAVGVATLDGLLAGGLALPPPFARAGDGEANPYRVPLMVCLAAAGRVGEAAALAVQSDTPPDGDGAPRGAGTPSEDQANAAFALGLVAATLGRPGAARRGFSMARSHLGAIGFHLALGWTVANDLQWVLLAYHADDQAACRRLAAEGVAAWERVGEDELGVPPRFAACNLLYVAGEWEAARALAEAAQAAAFTGWRAHAARVLGAIARHQGEAALAQLQVAALLPDGPDTAPGDASFLDALALQRLAAALALDDADLARAEAWLRAHDRWLAWAGATLGLADRELAWAGYHRAAGEPGRAQQRATQGLALATAPRQPLALLAAQRLLGEIATDRGQWQAAAQHLDQASALARACAAAHEATLTQLAWAAYHAARGERDTAAASLDAAGERGAALGARLALRRHADLAAQLGVARPRNGPAARLTDRQVAVLRLVAAGLTDAQIAERLHLARRTVSSYLTEIYNKLGVSGRAAATRVAVEQGLVDDIET
jgi:DNA-binding NarL/FixJ family response regulator